MMLARASTALALALAAACASPLAACAHDPAPQRDVEARERAPALDIWSALRGVWFGKADPTPVGAMPYALRFELKGDTIAAETPPPPGDLPLPDGAYQRFEIGKTSLFYDASLGGRPIKGTIAAQPAPDASTLVYCAPPQNVELPAANGCDHMKIVFALTTATTLTFDTWIDGKLHTHMVMTPPPPTH